MPLDFTKEHLSPLQNGLVSGTAGTAWNRAFPDTRGGIECHEKA
jgi:hypothetical protein